MRYIFEKKKVFTLPEVMMVAIIVFIIVGLGILSYRQLVENARQRVCMLNLKTLEKAIKFYGLEEDTLPATLGELKLRHLRKAYAEVMREGNYLLNKLAFFVVKINNPSLAYGKYSPSDNGVGFLTPETLGRYGVTEEVFHCPSDPSGKISYAMNENLAGEKWEDVAPGTPLVVCTSCPTVGENGGNLFDSSTGDGICGRHFKNLGFTKDVAEAVLKGGIGVKKKADELTSTFNYIENSCIKGYGWKDCTDICEENTNYGECMKQCREGNKGKYSSIMDCVKDAVD